LVVLVQQNAADEVLVGSFGLTLGLHPPTALHDAQVDNIAVGAFPNLNLLLEESLVPGVAPLELRLLRLLVKQGLAVIS